MNRERMEEFINFGFVPFCKSQCIKRLLCIWLFSAVLCFVGGGFKGADGAFVRCCRDNNCFVYNADRKIFRGQDGALFV